MTHIKHLAGTKNVVPDVLSRMHENNLESKIIDGLPWAVNNINNNITTRSKSKISDQAPANHKSTLDTPTANQNTAF